MHYRDYAERDMCYLGPIIPKNHRSGIYAAIILQILLVHTTHNNNNSMHFQNDSTARGESFSII